MSKIEVPKGMLKAAKDACPIYGETEDHAITGRLRAALQWLSENPPSLSLQDAACIAKNTYVINETSVIMIVKSALGKLFLTPEPEIPEEIKDLLPAFSEVIPGIDLAWASTTERRAQQRIIEAFRRGQRSK